jgi:hypothetical protein
MKSRYLRVVITAVAVCAGATAPAVASAVPAVPNGESFSVDFPAGFLCAFELNISGVNGQRLHDSGHGVIVFSGPFAATFTNLDTGAATSYNISGPTLMDKDGVSSVTGLNVVLQPSDVGTPFVLRTTGRVVFTADNTIASIQGTSTDVCALLS